MAGIYFHIPYCRRRCPYCSFVSFDAHHVTPYEYLSALLAELDTVSRIPEVRTIDWDTIYFGGGTPSIFPPNYIKALMDRTSDLFPVLKNGAEVTLEANPESIDLERLCVLREVGVNRISIGFQSLDDTGLAVLGRIHSALEAIHAYEAARRAGFTNIGVDLIYGWPGQGPKTWRRELEEVIRLGPEHISCYELTIEDGTPFAHLLSCGELGLPQEETVLALSDLADSLLTEHGYEHYEISNYARPGFRSRHNMNYWSNGAYLGLGCSAVSYIPPLRRRNTADLAFYCDAVRSFRSAVIFEEALDNEARFRETVVLALRTREGFTRRGLLERFGIDPMDYYGDVMDLYLRNGLIETDGDAVYLTRQGRNLANTVMAAFV
ncbi:MAG: radical SAM family heme chaperone HemW [Deltaproteobacteria bacterium]